MSPNETFSGSGPEEPAETLDSELRDALGKNVPEAEAQGALAAGSRRPRLTTWAAENRFILSISLATALVVGAIASLALHSVWFLVLALLIHAGATTVVVGTVFRLTDEVEKPDPATVADLQAHGVSDPEQQLNDAVRKVERDRHESGPS